MPPILAAAVIATATAGTTAAPVPPTTARQIKAEYGPLAYLPSFVPRGFIFTSWRIIDAQSYLDPALQVRFGRSGTILQWTVSDGRDRSYADCSRRPSYSFVRRINGRTVYYGQGNHGDDAWTCLSARTPSGFRQPIGIDLWIANQDGRPSERLAMRMVASARPVR